MKDCVIVSISDVHLGHRKTPTKYILENINRFLLNDSIFQKLDILFIVGDFFDHLLELNYEYLPDIDICIAKIFKMCEKHNVMLYVLEGTPSHDRLQSERFVTIAQMLKSPVAFKYVKAIETDYIPHLDCQLLFIPDEISETHEETLSKVHELMKAKGIDKFDIALMHGLFQYQVPQGFKIASHDYKEYDAIINTAIFIGHHHTHSVYKKAIAQGSFDRLCHGDEIAKGFVKVQIKNNKAHTFFIENKNAYPYITIDCTDLEMQDVFVALNAIDSREDYHAYIRLQAPSTHPVIASFAEVARTYQLLNLTKHIKEIQAVLQETATIEDDIEQYESIEITSSNILEIMMSRLLQRDLSQTQIQFLSNQLQEVHHVT